MKEYTLITGATSGLGYEFSKIFAQNGNNLILIGRRLEKLQEIKKELENLNNIKIEIISVDLSKKESVDYIYDFVNKKNIFVDNLINNAGFGSYGAFYKVEEAKDLEMIDVNIYALTKLIKKFLPSMIEKNKGGILNVASTAAFAPGVNMSVYYATKAYVLSLTEALYEECLGYNVKIMALCPGAVKTEFQEIAKVEKSDISKNNLMDAAYVVKKAYEEFTYKKSVLLVPGFKNKLLVQAVRFMPRWVTRKIIKKVNKG